MEIEKNNLAASTILNDNNDTVDQHGSDDDFAMGLETGLSQSQPARQQHSQLQPPSSRKQSSFSLGPILTFLHYCTNDFRFHFSPGSRQGFVTRVASIISRASEQTINRGFELPYYLGKLLAKPCNDAVTAARGLDLLALALSKKDQMDPTDRELPRRSGINFSLLKVRYRLCGEGDGNVGQTNKNSSVEDTRDDIENSLLAQEVHKGDWLFSFPAVFFASKIARGHGKLDIALNLAKSLVLLKEGKPPSFAIWIEADHVGKSFCSELTFAIRRCKWSKTLCELLSESGELVTLSLLRSKLFNPSVRTMRQRERPLLAAADKTAAIGLLNGLDRIITEIEQYNKTHNQGQSLSTSGIGPNEIILPSHLTTPRPFGLKSAGEILRILVDLCAIDVHDDLEDISGDLLVRAMIALCGGRVGLSVSEAKAWVWSHAPAPIKKFK